MSPKINRQNLFFLSTSSSSSSSSSSSKNDAIAIHMKKEAISLWIVLHAHLPATKRNQERRRERARERRNHRSSLLLLTLPRPSSMPSAPATPSRAEAGRTASRACRTCPLPACRRDAASAGRRRCSCRPPWERRPPRGRASRRPLRSGSSSSGQRVFLLRLLPLSLLLLSLLLLLLLLHSC